MITPAAPSVSSSLALAVGAQAGAGAVGGDDAATSGNFAALLQSTLPPAQGGAAGGALAGDPTIAVAVRQASGNVAGKVLPLDLPVAAAAAPDAVAEAPAADIILPGLVIPMTPRVRQAGKADQTIPEDDTSTGPSTEPAVSAVAATVLSPIPVDPMPIVVAQPAPGQAMAQTMAQTMAQRATETHGSAPSAHATVTPRPLTQISPAQAPTVTAPPEQGAQPAVEAPNTSHPATAQPATAFVMTFATPRTAAIANAAPTTIVRNIAPAEAKAESTEIKAMPTQLQPAAATINVLQPRETRIADTTKPVADTPAKPAPVAADAPPPAIVAPDARSFAQTLAPVETAPVGNRASAQSGHDFATLVDRLVEARQAAMPEAIHAAVRHSEFGQVSLRFDQDANGLSVSMTSADPDFAKAVQASAASAQTQTSSDNGSNAPKQDGRQDSQQTQQQTGSAFGQSQTQSQAQSQSGTREDRARQAQTETRSGRSTDRQQQDDDAAETRGGIYA